MDESPIASFPPKLAGVAEHFKLGNPSRVTRFKHGMSSDAYGLETENGAFIIKAVHGVGETEADKRRLKRELDVLAHLRHAGLPYATPEPLTDHNNSAVLTLDGVRYWAYPRLEGQHANQINPTILREIAHAVAHCTEALASIDCAGEPDGICTLPLTPAFNSVLGTLELKPSSERNAIERFIVTHARDMSDLADKLDKKVFPNRSIMAHADYHWVNLLFDSRQQLCAILDFGKAAPGPSVWDVADAASHYCFDDQRLNHFRTSYFIDAYKTIRPLTEDEERMIKPAMLQKYFRAVLRYFYGMDSKETWQAREAIAALSIKRLLILLHP